MQISWSKAQLQAIESRGEDLLVSAAAGSGKTAVLAERIVRRLADPADPADPARLLIVTFTRAAAAQMKEKIREGLDDLLDQDPSSRLLRRQILLLDTAKISTIHSLCSSLIQDHFDVLEIDPSYRMADENEIRILKHDIVSDVMEAFYASGNAAFRSFVSAYAPGRNDGQIADWILQTYEMSQSCPWPDWWLKKCLSLYEVPPQGIRDHILLRNAMEESDQELAECLDILKRARKLCQEDGCLPHYLGQIQEALDLAGQAQEAAEYEQRRERLESISLPAASRKKQEGADEDRKKEVKSLYDQVRARLGALREGIFARSPEDLEQELAFLAPSVRMLTELTSEFALRFREEKRDRNMLDFNDLEHLALDLLAECREDEQGDLTFSPTALADELAAWYEEVVCDEYQDSNRVQEMILEALSASRLGRHDRFMVGDVKQSIYRFRQADAAIFLEKYRQYPQMPGCRRLILDQNFRSRECVLSGVNALFKRLMRPECGGIDYDTDAFLKPGASFPMDESGTPEKTDLLLASQDDTGSDLSSEELEAVLIADEIERLTDARQGLNIWDPDLNAFRKARWGDIAVLLRSVKGHADVLAGVLSARGIPVSAQLSVGFFSAPEIRVMTSLLSVIDNPRQDIPLAAVLHSPIAGMSSEEMAFVRASHPEGDLYDALLACGRETPGYEKAADFVCLLEKLRRACDHMRIDELIEFAYDLTGYYDYASSMPAGARRRANLDMLLERAVTFMAGPANGLFSFMRYLEQIRENEIDFGEAAKAETDRGVSIVSIHKSKGLEYPVVILAGLGRMMNRTDQHAALVLHPQLGMGMNLADPVTRRRAPGSCRSLIADRLEQEMMAEELRILYVAMTRARERLILTGTVKDAQASLEKWQQVTMDETGRMRPRQILQARSFLDLIMPCILDTGAGARLEELFHLPPVLRKKTGEEELFGLRVCPAASLLAGDVEKAVTGRQALHDLQKLMDADRLPRGSEETGLLIQQLQADAAWQYPWAGQLGIRGTYSVSELKRPLQEEPVQELFTRRPDHQKRQLHFLSAEEGKVPVGSGPLYGTAFHRVMELLDLAHVPDEDLPSFIREQMESMCRSGQLEPVQAQMVRKEDVQQFLISPLGRRMAQAARAGTLHRESQFVMSVPADLAVPGSGSSAQVIIQGVIDAWFEEEGELILVDYKTDRVPTAKGERILTERYARQLDFYRMALEEAQGKKVRSRYIYAAALGRAFALV